MKDTYFRNCCFEAWGIVRHQASLFSYPSLSRSICSLLSKIDKVGSMLSVARPRQAFVRILHLGILRGACLARRETRQIAGSGRLPRLPHVEFCQSSGHLHPSASLSLYRHPEFCIACSFSSLACICNLKFDPFVKCHNITARSHANR
jgi:hypothetical protein